MSSAFYFNRRGRAFTRKSTQRTPATSINHTCAWLGIERTHPGGRTRSRHSSSSSHSGYPSRIVPDQGRTAPRRQGSTCFAAASRSPSLTCPRCPPNRRIRERIVRQQLASSHANIRNITNISFTTSRLSP